MLSFRTSLLLSLSLLISSCGGGGNDAPELRTYQSVWINASWSGGANGPPTNLTAVVPANLVGSHCPPNSLILDKNGTRFLSTFSNSREVLVFANTCTAPANLLVCVSAGSGGNASEFPVCNVDPRTTPLSRLHSVNMGPSGTGSQSMTWRTARGNLSLNIFYCAVGDAMTGGVIAGTNPTDCLVR